MEFIRDVFQMKNFRMFLISQCFMLGIVTCFQSFQLVIASIFTVIMIVLLLTKICRIREILIFTLVFYLGFILTFVKIKGYDDLVPLAPKELKVTGKIVSIPTTVQTSKYKFFLDVSEAEFKQVKAKTLVTLNLKSKDKKLNIGDDITLSGKLRIPQTSTNPSQFDYSKYLKNFNTYTVLYAQSSDVTVLNKSKGYKWKLLSSLNNIRDNIVAKHSKYLKSPNLEILGGIVFGDDAVSPPDYIKKSFINSGLLHILAASGMNVAFIYTFWVFILRFLRVPFKPRVLSGMLMVILYTLMTGLGASVVRASLMLLFVLAGKLINRDAHSISLLSFVAVLMLIYNPAYINDVSFQLSFLVTFGLLSTANIIASKLEKIPNWLKIPILIPIVAQIWVAPIQMFYFNTFSLYSILANISTVTLLSVISFCGFVGSILSLLPFGIGDCICHIFDFVLNYLLTLLVFISNFFSGLKLSLVQTIHPSFVQIFVYYVALLSITYLVKFNKYKYAVTTFSLCFVLLFVTLVHFDKHELEIITFDVQNADSFLIKTPQSKYFMIDTGKMPFESGNSQAKIIMLKYMKDRGIKTLDGLIVTHFDNDHAGGVSTVLKEVNVKKLYVNSLYAKTQTSKDIFDTAKEIDLKPVLAKNNTEIYSENNDLSIKTFMANIQDKYSDNENSIITLLSYKDFDLIFMGDSGVKAFENIKSDIPRNIEVLKVGHHGASKVVSEDMLKELGIKTSIISTGTNRFGHPNKGTLDILRNTEIYRTDLLNSIKVMTDGSVYKMYSYNVNSRKYELRNENFCK